MSSPDQSHGDSVAILPRGTMLHSAPVGGVRCRFKTVYDVMLAPVSITALGFHAFLDEPSLDGHLPEETTSAVSLTITVSDQLSDWRSKLPPRLRLFINGELSLRGALLDTLLIHTCRAFVKADRDTAWSPTMNWDAWSRSLLRRPSIGFPMTRWGN